MIALSANYPCLNLLQINLIVRFIITTMLSPGHSVGRIHEFPNPGVYITIYYTGDDFVSDMCDAALVSANMSIPPQPVIVA